MNTYAQCTLQPSALAISHVLTPSGISKKTNPIQKYKTNNIIMITKDIESDVTSDSLKSDMVPLHTNPFYETWFKDEDMDYIGFIIVFYNERKSPIGIDQLFALVREQNYYFTYPIIFGEDDDPNTFRYKKYIIQKCNEYFDLNKQNIHSITYVNDNNGIRNYVIRLKKLYPIHTTNLHTINCIDTDKYIWRQYIIIDSNWMNSYYLHSDFPDNYNPINVKQIYDTLNHT
jgi:hypothetical protein